MTCLYCGSHNVRIFVKDQIIFSSSNFRTDTGEFSKIRECLDCGKKF